MTLPSTLRILLVEDNILDQRIMLRHFGQSEHTTFEVHPVGDLSEALLAVEQDTFDCILLDLSLPDSSGLASVTALIQKAPKCPVVVLTGLDDPAIAVQAVEHGAQDYLTKQGLDADLATRSVRYAVARHQSESQLRAVQEQLDVMHERERIARDLHDTVIQQLFATGMELQALAGRVSDNPMRERLIQAVENIDSGIRNLREVIFRLHTASVGTVAAEVLAISEAAVPALGFSPSVRVSPSAEHMCAETRQQLGATLREALSNVAKHAKASAAQVTVETDLADVVLLVRDNGVGLGPSSSPGDPLTGRGLDNMSDRAAQLDGSFSVHPGPGGGTELEWRAPIELS